MITRLLAVGAVAFLVGAGPAKADPAEMDTKALQGTWEAVEQQPLQPVPDVTHLRKVVIAGGTLTWHYGRGEQPTVTDSAYKLDPAAKPKAIDFVPASGTEKGKTYLGIYELDGDSLKICYRGPGEERPTVFATKDGAMLYVLKRVPAGKADK
jgi:uncharacterized protein (TIGR03067 family)